MDSSTAVARALAMAFLADEFDEQRLVDRGAMVLGKSPKWLPSLARRIVGRFGGTARPRRRELVCFIQDDVAFQRASSRGKLKIVTWPLIPARMAPMTAAVAWNVPEICSIGALSEWLGVSVRELEWFADLRSWEAKRATERARNYRYRVLAKKFGQVRLIEAPKPRLKAIQRRVLDGIVNLIPPHDAAHGFRSGCSIRSFAAPHVGQDVVLKFDLQDFFPSIAKPRIRAIFTAAGYPESVADSLAGLCTNRTPDDIWHNLDWRGTGATNRDPRRAYDLPHLPQGAPTSPALANLCAFRLDCRLEGIARSAGANYTRYADDLAFSGGATFARVVHRFQHHACAIVLEENFTPNFRKTRIMRQGMRQRLAGIVVNERLNVARVDYDRLKATLTNCVRHGPESQNRAAIENFRAHLTGSVAFIESIHPERGNRLRQLLEQIDWT
ncbi:MAG: reverse transcriptase family protein [Planctomycetia bacterium]|nr:reverse transcriptase family protein [Planctomycetia bacterium]